MYRASYDEIKLNRIKQTVVKRVVYWCQLKHLN
jgi:hypothetical protein